jgi:hypothetical protein
MIPLNELQQWEVQMPDGEWLLALHCQLQPGDRIRKIAGDGSVLVDNGYSIYEVDTLPYVEVTPIDENGHRVEKENG